MAAFSLGLDFAIEVKGYFLKNEYSKLLFSFSVVLNWVINLLSLNTSFFSLFQAGPSRHVDDTIIIELQQRIRDLQEKLDSVGSYEVEGFFFKTPSITTWVCSINFLWIILIIVIMIMKKPWSLNLILQTNDAKYME